MDPKPCVLIPTYENPRTLEQVVRDAAAVVPDVIVVDDGSGPETQVILDGLSDLAGLVVLRHERNRGKGAALRTGLAEATRRGFSHALSMDSDGQHLASELGPLLAAVAESPDALILGHRDLAAAGAGPGSKIGRLNSNFWTWVVTGERLPDTQTGFRAYPLAGLDPLHLTGDRYDFEVEVLVKAAWSGVPLRSIPIEVRYFAGEQRVSHLRGRDYLRIARLNARYVTMRICLPGPYLELRSTRAFHERPFGSRLRHSLEELFVREPGSTPRIAASVALGLFWGVAPVWGFQIALALLSAHLLRLSKPVAVVASHVSFPLMIPPILYASLVLGRAALGEAGDLPALATLTLERADGPAYLLGAVLLGLALALVGGLLTGALVGLARRGRTGAA